MVTELVDIEGIFVEIVDEIYATKRKLVMEAIMIVILIPRGRQLLNCTGVILESGHICEKWWDQWIKTDYTGIREKNVDL